MASLNTICPGGLLPLLKPSKLSRNSLPSCKITFTKNDVHPIWSGKHEKTSFLVRSLPQDEVDLFLVRNLDNVDQQEGVSVSQTERDGKESISAQVIGFGGGERLVLDGLSSSAFPSSGTGLGEKTGESDMDKIVDRSVNALIVLAAGTFALTKLLTIDHDYWHGWTVYEILRYAPQHNWIAYEEALKTNPVFAKMMISGVVYSLGDWIAQCYEGKPIFEFDRARTFRSGLVGFSLHGSLSHYYYEFCEALFPYEGWWVVPVKVAFDQTIWSAFWNSIYYIVVGLLRLDSPASVFRELKATFWPMLTSGWKLWPFAHLITYSVIPVRQRLLWVDCVELIWVTILSTYSNEKAEAPAETRPLDSCSKVQTEE